jgi:hypothetical protein
MNAFFSAMAAVLAAVTPYASAANTGPTISSVSYPSTVTANAPATLSASVSTSRVVTSCNLYVDSDDKGAMTLASGSASMSYTFPRGGVFTVFVFCRDNAGGFSSGPPTSVYAQGAIVDQPTYGGSQQPSSPPAGQTPPASETPVAPPDAPSGVTSGSLIKLACPANAGADDPCKAVYYYGADGKRPPFPNSKAYFTWYSNFDSVKTVDAATLGSIPFGKNVTYRPGMRMVKFQTLNNVYAVSKGGVLRWVASEDVARALYGDNWNTKVDDIADTFFSNYTFGADITNAATYTVTTESAAATSIDQSL